LLAFWRGKPGCRPTVTEEAGTSPPRRVRVGIVDDSPEIRRLLYLFLQADDRFAVVGEAANGEAAIDMVTRHTPDLLILDHHMPLLSGVDALPEIRRLAPATAVVVYSAGADPHVSGRALAAGALAVMEKLDVSFSIVDRLADILLGHLASPEAEVELRLGPVEAGAARVWVDNTSKIVAAVRAHPEVLGEAVPDDVLDVYEELLETWRRLAAATEEFYWAARADRSEVERLVEAWARIDRMSDDQLSRLGVHWSPPEGEPFFHALTACVLNAISNRRDMESLVAVLTRQWTGAGADRDS
jgi:CheY-like chemotaxis protein